MGHNYLQILAEEFLHGSGTCFLIAALNSHSDGISLLDTQPHNRHQLSCHSRLTCCIFQRNGAVQCFGCFHQQTSRTRMNAVCILNGIDELPNFFLLMI